MSDEKFNADDYEKIKPTGDFGCAGCVCFKTSDIGLCMKLTTDRCYHDFVFKLKEPQDE